MNTSMATLDRFLAVQAADYEVALSELRRGRKERHWIWYIFPQLRGLGTSSMSREYGLSSFQEAQDYAAHPVLGARLRECVGAMCGHTEISAGDILGHIDAMKFRSCLTLFAAAVPEESLFTRGLVQFFGGERDPKTLALLSPERR